MTDDLVKHMVGRFLAWRLPENFSPDDGISFKPIFNEHTDHPARHEPTGTNLFDARQAESMIRHMLAGLPHPSQQAGTEGALRGLVSAWEVLGGGNYGPSRIQRWLIDDMKPAIDNARARLSTRSSGEGV